MGREKLDSVGIHDSYHNQPVLVGTVVGDHPTSEAPLNIPLVAFGGRVAGGVEVRGLVPAGTGPIGFTTYRSWVFRSRRRACSSRSYRAPHTARGHSQYLRVLDTGCSEIQAIVAATPNAMAVLHLSPSRWWSVNVTLE